MYFLNFLQSSYIFLAQTKILHCTSSLTTSKMEVKVWRKTGYQSSTRIMIPYCWLLCNFKLSTLNCKEILVLMPSKLVEGNENVSFLSSMQYNCMWWSTSDKTSLLLIMELSYSYNFNKYFFIFLHSCCLEIEVHCSTVTFYTSTIYKLEQPHPVLAHSYCS